MVRKISVVFTDSESDEFETVITEATLLTNDVILERFGSETTVLVTDEPISDEQALAHIDLATCRRLEISFLALDNLLVDKYGLDWIANASFIDVIRALAKN